jgi:hypothetical protein
MDNHQLNRILRLVKRTGDKFVVLDKATDAAQVLMSLDSYEDLLGPDFGDDFNPRDIPPFDGSDNFKLDENDEDGDDEAEFADWTDSEMPKRSYSDTSLDWGDDDFADDDRRTIQEIAEAEHMKAVDEEHEAGLASFPPAAEESLSDVPHEEEEEKFYLEPVE